MDTPARQLEAGQQQGGAYPCICGVKDVTFGDIGLFNAKPPYLTTAQRLQVLEYTTTWRESAKEGNLAPFETMKVCMIKHKLYQLYPWSIYPGLKGQYAGRKLHLSAQG